MALAEPEGRAAARGRRLFRAARTARGSLRTDQAHSPLLLTRCTQTDNRRDFPVGFFDLRVRFKPAYAPSSMRLPVGADSISARLRHVRSAKAATASEKRDCTAIPFLLNTDCV